MRSHHHKMTTLNDIRSSPGFKYIRILLENVSPEYKEGADFILNGESKEPIPLIHTLTALLINHSNNYQKLAQQVIKDLSELSDVDQLITRSKLTLAMPGDDGKYVANFLLTGKADSNFPEISVLLYEGLEKFKRKILEYLVRDDIHSINYELAHWKPSADLPKNVYDRLEYLLPRVPNTVFIRDHFMQYRNEEIKTANLILQDIIKLPGAKYLVPILQESLQHLKEPDHINLFTWLLTGKYIPNDSVDIKSYGLNPQQEVEGMVQYEIVGNFHVSPETNKQIFKEFIDDEIVRKAKFVKAFYQLTEIEGEDSDYELARFILDGERESGSDSIVSSAYYNLILDPGRLNKFFKDSLVYDKNDILDNLIYKMEKMGLNDEIEGTGDDKILYILETLVEHSGVNLENVQIVFEELFVSVPNAPECPPI